MRYRDSYFGALPHLWCCRGSGVMALTFLPSEAVESGGVATESCALALEEQTSRNLQIVGQRLQLIISEMGQSDATQVFNKRAAQALVRDLVREPPFVPLFVVLGVACRAKYASQDCVACIGGESAQVKGLRIAIDGGTVSLCPRSDLTRSGLARLNDGVNAVTFTDAGRAKLRTYLMQSSVDDLPTRFELVEAGVRISAGTLSHLFDALKQASATITRTYGGTRVGLPITHGLARFMRMARATRARRGGAARSGSPQNTSVDAN